MAMIDIATAIRQIKEGQLKPLYHLKGNDDFLQELFVRELETTLKKKGPFEKKILLVADQGGAEVLSWLTTMDMFVPVKVSVFRDPQRLKGNQRKEFLSYLARPAPGNYLITIDPGNQRKTAMSRSLEQYSVVIDVTSPDESGLRKWVTYLAREHKLDLAPEVRDLFITLAGDSLAHLRNEIEKLALVIDGKDRITMAMMKDFSTWQRSFVLDDFLKAVGNRDAERALQTGLQLMDQADSILALVFPLFTMFQELVYRKMARRGTFQTYRGFIPLSVDIRKRLPNFAESYQFDELVLAVQQLHEIDRRTKSTQSSALSELSQFVTRIVARNE